MFIDTIDPLTDPRWKSFVDSHPQASVFHHPSWLDALHRTYQFKPLAFTTARPGEALTDGLVFCPVRSWITGKRWVSLPFSDHCDLLADSPETRRHLADHFAHSLPRDFDYAEIRSTNPAAILPADRWQSSNRIVLHSLSLEPSPDQIFRGFHKSCVQRKIHKSEKEGLRYVSGRSEVLVDQFYSLLLRTRRRQRVPPQSFRWFQNLAVCMAHRLTVHIAFKEDLATAAILTLSHQKTLTYKYGCSDERFNYLGGMPFLFWQTIQQARSDGMHTFDLGRSEISNEGLVSFKEHLGATPTKLTYWTCTNHSTRTSRRHQMVDLARRVMPRVPQSMLRLPRSILAFSGSLFYRHLD